MSKLLGIDIGRTAVRATLLNSGYRRLTLEATGVCLLSEVPDLHEALKSAAGPLAQKADAIAVALNGDLVFSRSLELPLTAQKVLNDVVPFEIEAQLPFDISEAVFDYRVHPKKKGDEKITVFAAIAKITDVQGLIDTVKGALNHEVDLVIPGPFALSALSVALPELAAPGPVAVLDLGALHTEVVILQGGEPRLVRTLSVGVAGMPANENELAQAITQTFATWRANGGDPVQVCYLAGGGTVLQGAEWWVNTKFGVPAMLLPVPKIEGWPDAAIGAPLAKAAALAVAAGNRSRALNLRQGPLAFERGFGFLRDRAPMLAGLTAVVAVSFLFSTWAELRSLSQEKEALDAQLQAVSKDVLGEELHDPAQVDAVLEKGGSADDDPMPKVDGFDVLYRITEALPKDLKHDIDEIDMVRVGQQGAMRVTLHGVVPTVQDADDLATKLKTIKCFNDVKTVKTTAQAGGEAQKYHMEWEVRCIEETKKTKAASSATADAGAPTEKGAGQ